MSIRELSRSPRDRWPLEIETTPQEETPVARNAPQVSNHFATDPPDAMASLTPVQKRALLDQLLREASTAGTVLDLSRPIIVRVPFQEFPKALWTPDGKKQVIVHSKEHEEQMLSRGHSLQPKQELEVREAQPQTDSETDPQTEREIVEASAEDSSESRSRKSRR